MHFEAELMIDSCLWTCFIWYLFATTGHLFDILTAERCHLFDIAFYVFDTK